MEGWDESREWIKTGFTGAEPGSSLTCVFSSPCFGLEVSEALLLSQQLSQLPSQLGILRDNLWDRV